MCSMYVHHSSPVSFGTIAFYYCVTRLLNVLLQTSGTYQFVGTSILEILKFRSAIPPTGTRSLPVAKWRSFFCSSRGKASTTSQKHLVQHRPAGSTLALQRLQSLHDPQCFSFRVKLQIAPRTRNTKHKQDVCRQMAK